MQLEFVLNSRKNNIRSTCHEFPGHKVKNDVIKFSQGPLFLKQAGLANLLFFMEVILTRVDRTTTSILECQRQEISMFSPGWFV